jgi:hypothetical protein
MKKWIARRAIDFCCRMALKYDQRAIMLKNNDTKFEYVYALGSNIVQRDKWLKRINQIQTWIGQ